MALSRLDIKNMAAAELPAQRIDAEDEGSLEAEALEAAYGPALAELLQDHEYDFAITRATLATVANGRGHEWQYAYALPGDLSVPLRLLPYRATDTAGASPGYAAYGAARGFENGVPYRISGGVLYANQEAAVLEYSSNAPAESTFSPKFARALALEIASRAVMPIKKDGRRQRELIAMAEVARERAKAEDMNRDREGLRDFVPEVQLARLGWGLR